MANFFQKVLHFSLVLPECGEHFSIYYEDFGVFHKNSAENPKFCSPHSLFYTPILRKKQKKFATQTEKVVDVENSRCFTPTESPPLSLLQAYTFPDIRKHFIQKCFLVSGLFFLLNLCGR